MSEGVKAAKGLEAETRPPPADLVNGPRDGVKYPVKIIYCGECSFPLEYCQYYPSFEKCKQWLERNLPDEFERLFLVPPEGRGPGKGEAGDKDGADPKDQDAANEAKKSSRQKRGGKGLVKTKKKAAVDKHIGIARANRGKKKFVTVVTGLGTFEIDLKDAAKFFASRFACGSSVTGPDEIVIQGDVKDDLFDIVCEKWKEIDEDVIEDLGDRKL